MADSATAYSNVNGDSLPLALGDHLLPGGTLVTPAVGSVHGGLANSLDWSVSSPVRGTCGGGGR